MRRLVKELQPRLRRGGIEGLVEGIDNANERPLFKPLLAIDKRFIGMAQFARDWVKIEQQVDEITVPEVARKFLDYLALDLEMSQIPAEFSLPGTPLIQLGLNHEAIIEPVVLASLLNRGDVKILGMKVFQYLGPHIAEYIFPVLPHKVAVDYAGDNKTTLGNRIDPFYQLYCLENRTVEEIDRQNQRSIKKAAAHLCDGGVLMIFPNGGQKINRPWYRGTGQILSLLPPEVLSAMPIAPISVTGQSKKMFWRKAREAVFDQRKPAKIEVNVFDPIHLPSWTAGRESEELLDYLKVKTEARQAVVDDVEAATALPLAFSIPKRKKRQLN